MASRQTALIVGAGRIGRALGAIFETGAAGLKLRWWDSRPNLVPGQRPLVESLHEVNTVVLAVPAKALPSFADVLPGLPVEVIIMTISKGVPTDDCLSPAEYLLVLCPHHPIVVIGGPMMAEEMSADRPGQAVIASTSPQAIHQCTTMLTHSDVRVTTSADPISVSRAGVLKNIYGFIGGLLDGLAVSDRTAARQRLHDEYRLVASALNIPPEIIEGPAGIGDLRSTLSSPNSRNRRAGENISRLGHDGHGAEAIHSLPAVAAKLGVDIDAPYLQTAARILRREITPAAILQQLSII